MRPDFFLSLLDCSSTELMPFLRSLVQLGSVLLVYGVTCLGLSLLALDYSLIDLPILPHSSGCFGFPLLALYNARIGFSLPTFDHVYAESSTFLQQPA